MTTLAQPHRPDPRYSAAFLGALGLFLTAELRGLEGPRSGRTFTEQTRWVEARLPGPLRWTARVALLGITTWAGMHLAEGLS